VDQLSLEVLVGSCVVLDMRGKRQVDRRSLEEAPLGDHTRVLLKTDSGPRLLDTTFHGDYVFLAPDGAQFLVDHGVRLVGIDYLSIEQYDLPGAPVHRILLGAGIVVVEGVHLLDVPPGEYEIMCLPLRVKGADGAPARVILRRE
jgi:arylformamidase